MIFETYYYCLPSGRAPVKEFIGSLKIPAYRKFVYKKDLLEEFGPKLPMPHAKYLGNGLFELRFNAEEGDIRIIYFFENKKAILVHAFKKTTKKTPGKDLGLARERMNDYKEREYGNEN